MTSYTVTLLESDGQTYSSVLEHCDPSFNTTPFVAKQCSIPMTVVREPPYSVAIGSLITVRVQATNSKGSSDASEPNTTGALA